MEFIPVNKPGETIPEQNIPPKTKKIRTARQRLLDAQNQAEILPLVGEIWKTGELHILFADTGYGKSILAVSIADAISNGRGIFGFENGNPPQVVLFYDFELSDKQFQKRYSDDNTGELHEFGSHLFIDNVDWSELHKESPDKPMEDLIFEKIKYDLETIRATVLVVDNLTYLQTQTAEKTDVALNLMRRLMELKKEYGISILVLAHTPKRALSDPITINHLAGSKHLANFADGVSAIGKSVTGADVRYWKQVKPSRSGEMLYDAENVIVCRIEKVKGNFLTYVFERFSPESEHLVKIGGTEKAVLKEKAKKLKKKGLTVREIADELDASKSAVGRWMK